MTLTSPAASVPMDEALRAAIDSDRAYFELGARIERLTGARIAYLPGLAANPGGAVVHHVSPEAFAAAGDSWIAEVEARLRALGATLSRIYLDRAGTVADALLRDAGYMPRAEIAFAGEGGAIPDDSAMLSVRDDRGWQLKLRFHEAASERPDGHQSPASEWVAIERAKCGPGGLEAFLCTRGGKPVGAVNCMPAGRLLRLKNLVTHPARRRHGIGLAMIGFGMELARERGYRGICVFAIAGEAGERLYRAAGLVPVGQQIEWSRTLV